MLFLSALSFVHSCNTHNADERQDCVRAVEHTKSTSAPQTECNKEYVFNLSEQNRRVNATHPSTESKMNEKRNTEPLGRENRERRTEKSRHGRHTQTLINLIHLDLFYSWILLLCVCVPAFGIFWHFPCSSRAAAAASLKRSNNNNSTFPFIGGVESHSPCLYLVNYCTKFIIHALGGCAVQLSDEQFDSSLFPSHRLSPFLRPSLAHTHARSSFSHLSHSTLIEFRCRMLHRYRYFTSNNRYRFLKRVIFRSLRTKSINNCI